MKLRVLALSSLFAAALPLAAHAASCSRETFDVRGTPVTVSLCVTQARTDGPATQVAVEETYASAHASFTRVGDLRFISSEGPARVVESVDLAKLDMTGTLHMTLTYAAGEVRVESALLTPGAIIVK